MAEVELSAEHMSAHKVACEPLAEPIAALGLDHPLLPQVVVHFPGVELARKIDCPFGSDPNLHSNGRCENSVVKKIRFQCHILTVGRKQGYEE